LPPPAAAGHDTPAGEPGALLPPGHAQGAGSDQLVPRAQAPDRFGIIEYADQGEGLPLLVSHGVLGCHVDTVDSWWARLTGPGFRVIGPSRFGYFGSALPAGATPADQADAYALLLDHLGVDRAVVIAFSPAAGPCSSSPGVIPGASSG